MGSVLRRSRVGNYLFDVNALAEGHDAYIFAGYAVSPDNKLAAYFANTTGSYAEFDLHIRDLERGEDLAFTLSGVSSLAWAEDSETIYYTLIDETLRSTKAFCPAPYGCRAYAHLRRAGRPLLLQCE